MLEKIVTLREVVEKSVEKSVVEKCCREVVEKSVVEKCCREEC